MNGTSAPTKETTEYPSSSHHVRTQLRSAACSLQPAGASPGLVLLAPRSCPSESRTLRNGAVVSELPVPVFGYSTQIELRQDRSPVHPAHEP